MGSLKTKVVEHLFDKHWDVSAGKLVKSLMSLDEVAEAIRETNVDRPKKLKANNPANFMKDLLRGANASKKLASVGPSAPVHRAFNGRATASALSSCHMHLDSQSHSLTNFPSEAMPRAMPCNR